MQGCRTWRGLRSSHRRLTALEYAAVDENAAMRQIARARDLVIALCREAMVNNQPLNWVSDDTLRRITGELGNVSDALPNNLFRLLGRLVEASKWIGIRAEGT